MTGLEMWSTSFCLCYLHKLYWYFNTQLTGSVRLMNRKLFSVL